MADGVPSRIDYDTQTYWRGLQERTLRLARCKDCAHWIHPPRACCPVCWSDNVGHDVPSGEATLFSYILQPLAAGAPPSVIGWAELVEQERLLVVAPIENVTPQSVCIGAKLTLGWAPSDKSFLPVFLQETAS